MMKNMNLFLVYSSFIVTITYFTLLPALGSSVGNAPQSKVDDLSTISQTPNSLINSSDADDYSYVQNITSKLQCNAVEYKFHDVTIFENGSLIIKEKNITIHSLGYQKNNDTISVCQSLLNCSGKFEYEKDQYQILPNNSVIVDDEIYVKGEYELDNDVLLICYTDEDYPTDIPPALTLKDFSIYVGQAGGVISIAALTVHLLTFLYLPALRNLPGYNLASLSLAFLLAYTFFLIGQIPKVRGKFCVASAVLEHNFFLVAFFCMNVLAFDVWRMLKLTTQKLVVRSQITRRRQFVWYSLYAWGVPFAITFISVLVDNVDGIPRSIKPNYGKDDVCFMNNNLPKAIFFAVPAFTLFLVNAVFFIMSSWIISSNKMKVSRDQTKQTMKLNYVLYVRLAIMMGLTWLVGLIGIVSGNRVVWFVFDLLNPLQGLFLFLLFTCTKKVLKQVAEKSNSIRLSSVRQHTLTTNSNSRVVSSEN